MKTLLAGYCYVCRGVEYDVPFEAAVSSFAKLCDEVVVLTDPRFQDGTLGKLNDLASHLGNLRVGTFTWRLDHPAADGMAKALARKEAERTGADVLVSFDADEVLHEDDVPKLRRMAHEMVTADNMRVVGTGVFNWFNGPHVKWCEPITKERMSLRLAGLTHGVPGSLRVYSKEEDRGYYYAMTNADGAGYIHEATLSATPIQRMLCEPMKVFEGAPSDSEGRLQSCVTARTQRDLERMVTSLQDPEHVWIRHYSWWDIPRKWEMKSTWHYLWHHLWGEYPRGLSDYTRNRDTQELIDFWEQQSVPVYHIDHYAVGIDNQMEDERVLRADWVKHPDNEYLRRWLNSSNRRVQGRKLAVLPRPPSRAQKAWRAFVESHTRKKYRY